VLGLRVEVYQDELVDGCRLAEGGDSAGLRSVTVPVLSLFSVWTVPLSPRRHVLILWLVVDGLEGVSRFDSHPLPPSFQAKSLTQRGPKSPGPAEGGSSGSLLKFAFVTRTEGRQPWSAWRNRRP
jgi:hypothetical protein